MAMRVENADERDSGWESQPRFRVYFFRGGDRPGSSWSVTVHDVLDADVLQTVHWAETEIGDEGLFAVALVEEHDGERGLVWLVGMDANDEPSNELERARRAAMDASRGRQVVRPIP
jgi:hypothetical protein